MPKITEKDKTVIRSANSIEIEGVLYFIPEKYTANMELGMEHKTLFNIILANVMHSRIKSNELDINIENITKTHMEKWVLSAERIFSYCVTGKLDSGITFQKWERDILAGVPGFIIPKLNPLIVERIDC